MLCGLLAVLSNGPPRTAAVLGVLTALVVAGVVLPAAQARPVPATLLEAVSAGSAVGLTGGAASPLLPYLLAPALVLGLSAGWREVVAACGLQTAAALSVQTSSDGARAALEDVTTGAGQWLGLALAFGLVAVWGRRLAAPGAGTADERYVEARALLEQLRGVARRLPGGLDASTAAGSLLERCAQITPSARSAVLVQPSVDGSMVPVAVRGTTRVPWRTPLSEAGPLQQAWQTRQPLVDRRAADTQGRRAGSSLAVVPLLTGTEPLGLLILEAFDAEAFDVDVLDEIAAAAEEAALRLETALLFEEVRSAVSLEERGRLAREMHDGVAQELAFVGYQLDDLRQQAGKVDDGLAEQLRTVRTGLTGLISDLRLSITDLRTSVASDRGLGAAITSYVRAVGSGQRLTVHVSLQESAFRLAGEHEVLLLQVTQAVAQSARRNAQARNFWVILDVDPPSASLTVEHDGPAGDGSDPDLSDLAARLTRHGGGLTAAPRPGGGVAVQAWLEGGHP